MEDGGSADERLERVFALFCGFGRGAVTHGRVATMDAGAFVKLVTEAGLALPPLEKHAIDLVFRRACIRGQRKISASQFRLLAVPLLAQERWPDVDLVDAVQSTVAALVGVSGPQTNVAARSQVPNVVSRLTDVASYTGRHRSVHEHVASHRLGGAPMSATADSGAKHPPARRGFPLPVSAPFAAASRDGVPHALDAFDMGRRAAQDGHGLQARQPAPPSDDEVVLGEPVPDYAFFSKSPPFEAGLARERVHGARPLRSAGDNAGVPWPPTLSTDAEGSPRAVGPPRSPAQRREPNVLRRMRSRGEMPSPPSARRVSSPQARGRAAERSPTWRPHRSMSPGVENRSPHASVPPPPPPPRRHRSSSPPAPTPRPNARMQARLYHVFLQYCSFGISRSRTVRTLDSFRAAKLVRDCGIVGGGVTQTDVDVTFARLTGNASRRMDFPDFKHLLAALACKRFPAAAPRDAFAELASRVCAAPDLSAPAAPHVRRAAGASDVVARLTDPSGFTGQHRQRHGQQRTAAVRQHQAAAPQPPVARTSPTRDVRGSAGHWGQRSPFRAQWEDV